MLPRSRASSKSRATFSRPVSVSSNHRLARFANRASHAESGSAVRGWKRLVAPAGFEPAVSALRGLRPRPLDDGAAIGLTTLPEAQARQLECTELPLRDDHGARA